MPVQGFTIIDQYRSLAKDWEQASCSMLPFDMQVPSSRHVSDSSHHVSDEYDSKVEIKQELVDTQSDIYSVMMDNIFSSNSITGSTLTELPAAGVRNSSSCGKFSSLLSSSSCCSSPMLSTKTTTFVTEKAGSGCTLVSNSDFLLQRPSSSDVAAIALQEDTPDYMDLDRPHLSFYDDLEPSSQDSLKSGPTSDEPNSPFLEEAVFLMHSVLRNDCGRLNVPFDVMRWTNEHVRKWVSWVCHKNNVEDVSSQLYGVHGPGLCALSVAEFSSRYRSSAESIFNELEVLKAANSCFPNQSCDLHQSQHLHNPFMESTQTCSVTPCVSPVPSSGSCSHDSTISTPSDSEGDADVGFGTPPSQAACSADSHGYRNRLTGKLPTGRGHKQTIHLWQFLKELLLSKDNHADCIRWLDRKAGIFKIEDSKRVAYLWGARKNRPAMNYDKLSRSVRQYYKKGIIKKTTQSKRLVYQFCPAYL